MCVLRTFKMYSFSSFQEYNTILFTIVTMLSIESWNLLLLWLEVCSLCPMSSYSPQTPGPWRPPVNSLFLSSSTSDSMYRWCYTVACVTHNKISPVLALDRSWCTFPSFLLMSPLYSPVRHFDFLIWQERILKPQKIKRLSKVTKLDDGASFHNAAWVEKSKKLY